jgi:hypothetical protein
LPVICGKLLKLILQNEALQQKSKTGPILMLELAPNIFYIPGENDSRFPYCACLYLKGQKRRVLNGLKWFILKNTSHG